MGNLAMQLRHAENAFEAQEYQRQIAEGREEERADRMRAAIDEERAGLAASPATVWEAITETAYRSGAEGRHAERAISEALFGVLNAQTTPERSLAAARLKGVIEAALDCYAMDRAIPRFIDEERRDAEEAAVARREWSR